MTTIPGYRCRRNTDDSRGHVELGPPPFGGSIADARRSVLADVADLPGAEALRARGAAMDCHEIVAFALAALDEAGVTVPDLLRREAARLTSRPTMTEWLERTRRRPSEITTAEVLSTLDDLRGPWPDAGR